MPNASRKTPERRATESPALAPSANEGAVMGRMFDVVSQPEARRGRPVAIAPRHDLDDDQSDVPFVEVGGPKKTSSATVAVAEPPKPAVKATTSYLTVQFQALPTFDDAGSLSRFAPELVAFHQPDHAVSKQYREIVDALRAQNPGTASKLLLFTAAHSGAGTTTVVLNLAITLARHTGLKVAVVDANLARPSLASKLGLAAEPGMREVIARTAPLKWALQATTLAGLTVLAAGRPMPPIAPLVGLESLPDLADKLRERFDWVLFDAASWEARPEAALLAEGCDSSYLVLRQDRIDEPETEAIQQTMAEYGAALRGCVLTQS